MVYRNHHAKFGIYSFYSNRDLRAHTDNIQEILTIFSIILVAMIKLKPLGLEGAPILYVNSFVLLYRVYYITITYTLSKHFEICHSFSIGSRAIGRLGQLVYGRWVSNDGRGWALGLGLFIVELILA